MFHTLNLIGFSRTLLSGNFIYITLCIAGCLLMSCTEDSSPEKDATYQKETTSQEQNTNNQSITSNINLNALLPVDKDMRIGVLDNGMTYYIKRNNKPENRVNLSLAVNAGSVQEKENQRGLAHFIEHMAFNGTKHFEKNELIGFLESLGAGFGSDINAYTSFDETVYQLDLPSNTSEMIDKGLLVMQDWATGMSFSPEEIEKERGVIKSEKEARLGAQQRFQDAVFPKILNHSPYAERSPIGLEEIFMNAPRETFLDFYHTWYRPDSMAIIAVGEFDLDLVENKIKDMFGKLQKPTSPPPTISKEVPSYKENVFVHLADKEQTQTQLIIFKLNKTAGIKKVSDYQELLIKQMLSSMFNNRLIKLARKNDAPFLGASGGFQSLVRHIELQQLGAVVKNNNLEGSLKTLIQESQRVAQYGFIKAELVREKQNFLNYYENSYKERNKTNSKIFIQSSVAHFLSQDDLMSAEQQLELVRQLLDNIQLSDVNQYAKKAFSSGFKNVIVWEPESTKSKISNEIINTWITQAESKNLVAYQEEETANRLMTRPQKKVSPIGKKSLDEVGVTELTYPHGIRVILKPTSFKDDEISMAAFRAGGTSLYSDNDYLEAEMASDIVSRSGVGQFNSNQLQNFMADKNVGVSFFLNELYETISGNTTNKDLEVMLQLTHLYFTQPRFDLEIAQIMLERQKQQITLINNSPDFYLRTQSRSLTNNNHFRFQQPTLESLNTFDLKKSESIYKERFAYANNFTFVFTGSFKVEQIQSLIDHYIATLPHSNDTKLPAWNDVKRRPTNGVVRKDLSKGDTQKSTLFIQFNHKAPQDPVARQEHDFVSQILGKILLEKLREEMGSTYSPRAGGFVTREPESFYHIYTQISSNPKDLDKIIAATMKEIKSFKTNGPEEDKFNETKQVLLKSFEKSVKTNSFWHNNLINSYRTNSEPKTTSQMLDIINKVTLKDVQKAANRYLDTNWYTLITMSPEK